ncbi:hypothetical protein Gotri_028077 [Gossypium trilobum]|uniref:Myb/SANT-like domain-containing protein n=2 Tax=Gossypium trilobum TaxID=34281 RepID=A0A7J9FKA2_9ROSI|nr:hypothetical protein [Gossypium trilobum]
MELANQMKWVPEEDVALVACMVDLHNVGTFNTDTGFNVSYLNELERMLEIFLPHAMLKAKPNLESIIRTLKRDSAIVYDMLSEKDNSGFGWDKHRQLVVAEDTVVIKKLVNLDIIVVLIMTNLLPSTQ